MVLCFFNFYVLNNKTSPLVAVNAQNHLVNTSLNILVNTHSTIEYLFSKSLSEQPTVAEEAEISKRSIILAECVTIGDSRSECVYIMAIKE